MQAYQHFFLPVSGWKFIWVSRSVLSSKHAQEETTVINQAAFSFSGKSFFQ